jgi:hypothetical protein
MFTSFKSLILVAESNRTHQVMQAFRSAKKDEALSPAWLGLMIAAACLAVLVLAVIIGQRLWRRMGSSPQGLFLELCHAHRLKWPQRRLLWRLAQSQKLTDPASLFLAPACFEIGRLTVEMRPHTEELHKLRERLFAETRAETKSAPGSALRNSHEEQHTTAALPLAQIPPTLDLPQGVMNTGIGDRD